MTNRNDDDGHSEAWNKASKEVATRVGVAIEDGDSYSDCLSAKRLVATHTHAHLTGHWLLLNQLCCRHQLPSAAKRQQEKNTGERETERGRGEKGEHLLLHRLLSWPTLHATQPAANAKSFLLLAKRNVGA